MGTRARAREDLAGDRDLGTAPRAAEDFWGEASGELQDPIQGPAAPVEPGHLEGSRAFRPRAARLRAVRVPHLPVRLPERRGGPRPGRVRTWSMAAAAVVVVGVIVVAVIGSTEHSARSANAPTRAASVRSTRAGTKSPAAPLVVPGRSVLERPSTRAVPTRHPAHRRRARAATHRRHATRHVRHVSHQSTQVNSAPPVQTEQSTVTQYTSPTASPPPSTPVTPVSPPSAPVATSSSSGGSSSGSSSGSDSGSGGGGSGGGSSSAPAGPTGVGSATGCNPKCS